MNPVQIQALANRVRVHIKAELDVEDLLTTREGHDELLDLVDRSALALAADLEAVILRMVLRDQGRAGAGSSGPLRQKVGPDTGPPVRPSTPDDEDDDGSARVPAIVPDTPPDEGGALIEYLENARDAIRRRRDRRDHPSVVSEPPRVYVKPPDKVPPLVTAPPMSEFTKYPVDHDAARAAAGANS